MDHKNTSNCISLSGSRKLSIILHFLVAFHYINVDVQSLEEFLSFACEINGHSSSRVVVGTVGRKRSYFVVRSSSVFKVDR